VPAALKLQLSILGLALLAADNDEFERTPIHEALAVAQEKRHKEGRTKIFSLYTQMLPAVQAEVQRFVKTVGLTWTQTRAELRKLTQQESWTLGVRTQQSGRLAGDTYVVALSTFLTAIHKYLRRHGKTEGLK
jgi:hypothetical protein